MNVIKRCAGRLLTAALLISPASAWAQTPSSSFTELSNTVKPGQTVTITEADGRRTKGTILSLSNSFIALRVRGRRGVEERRQFAESSVTAIRRDDAVWNGLLIGLASGIAAAEVWRRVECGPRGFDSECSAIVSVVGWATMVPGGAVAGALIDKFTGNPVVYRAAARQSTFDVAPVLGYGRAGLRATMRF